MAEKTALVIIEKGIDEIESVAVIDILRRAGVKVTVAGHSGADIIKCSRDAQLKPEVALTDVKSDKFDIVIIPGGYHSAEALCKSELVAEILKAQEAADGLVAANCSGPLVLQVNKIYPGKKVTGFPSLSDRLNENFVYQDMKDSFVDGNVITGRGPGQSIVFGLKCAEALVGLEVTKKVAKDLLVDYTKLSAQ